MIRRAAQSGAALVLLCAALTACARVPARVAASYDLYRNGNRLAVVSEQFERTGDQYRIRSETKPAGLLALVSRATQTVESRGRVTEGGLRPEHFAQGRSDDPSRQSAAEFDWAHGRITLQHSGRSEVQALAAGTQDRLSVMYQFMLLAPDHRQGIEFAMTNGTDEAIQVLVNTFVNEGDEVLLLHPSYAMYKFYSELAGATVRELEYHKETLAFPLTELLAGIRPQTRAILIANPNNPTGTGVTLDQIRAVLEAAPHAAVLIDEAYFEFSGVTVLPWIRQYKNLFVSRTFSKVYGMAAMRCGCLFSDRANVAWMRKAQSPYSVNALAAIAARAAVKDTATIANYVDEVLAARKLAYEGLAKLGIRAFDSQANFILFYAGDRSIPIRDALRDKGVLIRDRSYEIQGCVRVTIGTRAQIERFLKELEILWNR